ncbi:MAG: MarR family transcriptional regulator, partial [Pseudonocardiaceae bacterium]|nr:MarR family transcriptional regulator [Pseudonocardiaceae bacterium]
MGGAGYTDEDVRQFVEHTAMALAEWGFPRMAARVLMAAMVSDDGVVTARGLSGQLGVSPAAVSGAVRYLIHVGLFTREPAAGSRRDHYRLRQDLWYEASLTKNDRLLARLAELAEDGAKALGGPSTAAGARVAEMRDFFAFLQSEVPAM